jgi:hypothetical protein
MYFRKLSETLVRTARTLLHYSHFRLVMNIIVNDVVFITMHFPFLGDPSCTCAKAHMSHCAHCPFVKNSLRIAVSTGRTFSPYICVHCCGKPSDELSLRWRISALTLRSSRPTRVCAARSYAHAAPLTRRRTRVCPNSPLSHRRQAKREIVAMTVSSNSAVLLVLSVSTETRPGT